MINHLIASDTYNKVLDSSERFMLKEGLYYPSFYFLFEGHSQDIVYSHRLILIQDSEKNDPDEYGNYLSAVMMSVDTKEDALELQEIFKFLVKKYDPSAACAIIPGQYKEYRKSTIKNERDRQSLLMDPESIQVLSSTYFIASDPEGMMKLTTIISRGILPEEKRASALLDSDHDLERNYDMTFFKTTWAPIPRNFENSYPNPYIS